MKGGEIGLPTCVHGYVANSMLSEYVEHDHQERCHQGLGNVMPFRARQAATDREGPMECRERLGGLLKYYNRKAA